MNVSIFWCKTHLWTEPLPVQNSSAPVPGNSWGLELLASVSFTLVLLSWPKRLIGGQFLLVYWRSVSACAAPYRPLLARLLVPTSLVINTLLHTPSYVVHCVLSSFTLIRQPSSHSNWREKTYPYHLHCFCSCHGEVDLCSLELKCAAVLVIRWFILPSGIVGSACLKLTEESGSS